MVGVYYHDLFVRHLEGYDHVERPDRLRSILARLKASPIVGQLQFVDAQPAETAWLERVHDKKYVEAILNLEVADAVMLDWGDTVATPATPQAALHAAGAGVQAVRAVLDGTYPSAFCAVRPPGHHAERDRAMGFCVFNNIAVAASYLVDEAGLERVGIVDWDIHHGNGTESAFAECNRVLYISLHQYPHYPGTGHPDMTGKGPGIGFTLNIPMGAGAGDDDYRQAFKRQVLPTIDDFKPQFLLISAGFDAHANDPLSATRLSSAFFGEMTRMLKDSAAEHCHGRIVSFLEGGYNVDTLAESVEEHLKVLVS